MFEFTSLFLNNFIGGNLLLEMTTLSPTVATAVDSSSIGFDIICDDNDYLYGTSWVSIGTAFFSMTRDAYQETKEQLELTQAYVESLSEDELKEFILKLEDKDASFVVDVSEDVKVKKL